MSDISLVSFENVREHLQKAEASIAAVNFNNAVTEIAISKELLFSMLDKHIPKVDSNLKEQRSFKYIANYLDKLREISLITLLRVPFADYNFLQTYLPSVFQSEDGKWTTVNNLIVSRDETECRRAIEIIVKISIQLKDIL